MNGLMGVLIYQTSLETHATKCSIAIKYSYSTGIQVQRHDVFEYGTEPYPSAIFS